MRYVNPYIPQAVQAVAHAYDKKYKLYGGSIGGGKSKYLCEEIKELAMQFPGGEFLICRQYLEDFMDSTYKELLRTVGDLMVNHNQQKKEIILCSGSTINYGGLYSAAGKESLKSTEYIAIAVDEASEMPKEKFLWMIGRLRGIDTPTRERLQAIDKMNLSEADKKKLQQEAKSRIQRFILLASNPDDCWLKPFFMDGNEEGNEIDLSIEKHNYTDKHGTKRTCECIVGADRVFIPAFARDNKYIDDDYEAELRKVYPADWQRMYLDGCWEIGTGSDKIINYDDIRMAINREVNIEDKPIISCDIAAMGGDETVIYYGKGYTLLDQDIGKNRDTMDTAGRILNMYNKYNAKMVVMDGDGMGIPVVQRLQEMGVKVTPFLSGGKTLRKDIQGRDLYFNLKTEAWFLAKELFHDGKVSILNDPKLTSQLAAVKYTIRSSGKLWTEQKNDLRKRISSSPDRADALIMMLWGANKMRDSKRDFARRGAGNFKSHQAKGANSYGWNYSN